MSRRYTADRRRIATMRLTAQLLAPATASGSIVGSVRHLLALQAQDLPGARWAIGVRTPGTTERDVAAVLDAGEIVRSWAQRGTLHIVPPEDLGWMLGLTAARMRRQYGGVLARLGIDDEVLARARRVAERATSAGPVPRRRLLELLDEGGVDTSEQRGTHTILQLATQRVIVHGPMEGAQPTFAAYDARVPAPAIEDRDEALAVYARRYLAGHGPATVRDLAWWSGLTLTDARRGLAAVQHEFAALESDGATYWHAPGLEPAPRGVLALAGFDETLLGYQDRSAPLHPEHASSIVPGGNGMFLPTVVVDGEVVATWRRTAVRGRDEVAVTPLGTPLGQRDAVGLRRAVASWSAFTGREAVVSA